MKKMIMLLTITGASALFGADRTLDVSFTGEDWKALIRVSGSGGQNQKIIAAWSNGDKGDDPLNWSEYADAGTLAPGETEAEFTIPEKWRGKSGAMRFFLMSGMPPYAKRLDYATRPVVDTDEHTFVNTTIYPDPTLDIRVKVQSDYMSGNPGMSPFGIASTVYVMPNSTPGMSYWFDFFGAKNTTSNGSIGKSNTNVYREEPPKDTLPHEFRLNREGFFIDGCCHLVFDQTKIIDGKSAYPITLFGRYNGWKQKDTSCSIYYAVITTNGVPARNYIPCYKTDGTVTMYDRVTKTFANIAGNGENRHLVAGNDIGPDPIDCGEVECFSDAVMLAPRISLMKSGRLITVNLSSGHDEGMLFVVADEMDEGNDLSAWANCEMIQKVPANVDSVTVDIPAEWWRNNLNVRFAWKSLQGRPYDYEVDCLNSDGAGRAHILTGWIPTKDTSISVAAKAGQRVCTFGVATYFTLFLNTGDPAALYWGFFGNSGNKPLKDIMAGTFNDFLSQYHVWQLGPQGASIDGESLVSFSEFQSASDLSSEITLPFRANKGGNTLSGLEGDVSVKNAKIWEGEVLVRDFVPCVKNGVAGFYDRVRGTFRSSKTEAEFTAGTAVIAVDDGDIVSWSDVRELRTGTVVVFK